MPDALATAGISVERHSDYFKHDAADVDWLPFVGKRGWVALTHNRTIRTIERERDMVMRAGVRLFVLIGAHPHPRHAANVVHSIHKIGMALHKYSRHGEPFIARLYMAPDHKYDRGKGGEIKPWLTLEQWEKEGP